MLPLLALLLAAVVDMGRAFQSYIVITNAARDGARTGARLSCYANDATQRAKYRTAIVTATIAAAAGNGVTIENGNITLDPDPTTRCANKAEAFKVTVQYPVDTIMGGFVGTNTFQMRSRAAMSKFGAPIP